MMGASATLSCTGEPNAFSSARLERVFASCFAQKWRTQLVGGAQEPFYQPAESPAELNRLYYRADYFASALHEVSHWCIAGQRRRTLPDFGYWYAPDGRNIQQQQAFEVVECKPQALEWWFSRACGYRFRVSIDNLESPDGTVHDCGPFKQQIAKQARAWQSAPLPGRARLFVDALSLEFGSPGSSEQFKFNLAELA